MKYKIHFNKKLDSDPYGEFEEYSRRITLNSSLLYRKYLLYIVKQHELGHYRLFTKLRCKKGFWNKVMRDDFMHECYAWYFVIKKLFIKNFMK